MHPGDAAVPVALVASCALLAALLADVVAPDLAPATTTPIPTEPLPQRPLRSAGRYELRVALDPVTHRLVGEGTIDLVNVARSAIDHVWVHLYLNGFESERTVFQRGPSLGFRGGGGGVGGRIDVRRFAVPAWGAEDLWPHDATTPGEPDDRTDIRVPLGRSVAPGEVVQFEVAWDATLPPVSLRTGWQGSFHMAGQWFPKLAKLEPDGTFAHFPFERLSEFYADFTDWDVTITTPPSFVVGATGVLTEERPHGSNVARRFVQDGVHDFAFAAWDQFREVRAEHRGVAIRCLHPPGGEAAAAREVEVAVRGLDVLGARWGKYPFATLTLVHPPAAAAEAGGMEYPTLITTGGPWWGPLAGARFAELVTVHELAHQWFQGLLASNEREHPFLDEGLTTYAEMDAMDVLVPPGSSASLVLGLPLATTPWYRAAGIGAARRTAIGRAPRDFPSGGDYGALVYGRTATILRTLDRVHGGAVQRALEVYARRHRFGHPTPDDLVRAVREEAGDEAASALSTALFDRGWIDVSLEGVTWRATDGGFDVDVAVARAGPLSLPVDIEVLDEAGASHRARWDGRAETATVTLRLPAPPRFAVVDPEHHLLLDDDLLDGTWAARAAPPVAGRTLGATSFLARAALAVLGP